MKPSLRTLLPLALVALATPVSAQIRNAPVRYDSDHLSAAFHAGRREAVMERLPEDALAILFSAPARNRTGDSDYEYRQQSDLLYLTGSDEPGTVLVLAPGRIEIDGTAAREVLFVPPRDPTQEVWDGRRWGADRAMEQLGLELALDNTRFTEVVVPLLRNREHTVFHLPLPDGVAQRSMLIEQLGPFVENVDRSDVESGGTRDGTTLRQVLDELRAVKTAEEMALLERAIAITVDAHQEVMRQVEPGWAEYEIEGLLEFTFRRGGAEGPGFPSIVGSAENSVILHYNTNRRVTEPGDVVVIDIGAEYHGYTADVTRTIPVSGRFSSEQRSIYDLVYRAQEAGIEASRAGAPFAAVNGAASRVLAEGLAELGLISGADDERGLFRFFMHGTSHYLGLDVHDVGSYDVLEAGNVITVEPGIYIAPASDVDPKWWNIGVRIEDDILITDGAPLVLSAGAPRHPDEVEAFMRGDGGR